MKSKRNLFSSVSALRGLPQIASFVISLCAAHVASAADQTWTGATSANWNTAGNWSGAAIPGASDLAVFNAASTANLGITLGADSSVLGLSVTSPGSAVSIAAGNTLTIGASGIAMGSATQDLTLNSAVVLGASQSWNNSANLSVSGVISGATFGITKLGAGAQLYATRMGRINLACVHCHDGKVGANLRAEVVSPGHPSGFPIYRLNWQNLGSIDRRLRACYSGVQATLPPSGSPALRQLELYLKVRAGGMPLDGPSIRR